QIVLVEEAEVLHVVLQKRHALDSETPGEACVLLRVDAAVAEHVGVDHAAAAGLQPALVAAAPAAGPAAASAERVELEARLGVGAIGRPHAHAPLGSEERVHNAE